MKPTLLALLLLAPLPALAQQSPQQMQQLQELQMQSLRNSIGDLVLRSASMEARAKLAEQLLEAAQVKPAPEHKP